jgi:hypothetical protein
MVDSSFSPVLLTVPQPIAKKERMKKQIIQLAAALALTVPTFGCAPQWVVLDESVTVVAVNDEKVRLLNAKHKESLRKLASALSQRNVSVPIRDGVFYNYVTFDMYKGEPAVTIYTDTYTAYNLQQTSKVSRAASSFSERLAVIIKAMGESGTLEASEDYKHIKVGVTYSVQDFSINDALARALTGKRESAEYFIPTSLAKQYINQDISVQELLAGAVVLIDGERNVIKTQDRAID